MNNTQIINSLSELSADIYCNAIDHGFHDDDKERSMVENAAIWSSNLHGEVSEFWEAARKNELADQCDKNAPLTCASEELADILIRVCDTAMALGIDIGQAVITKHEYNKSRAHKHGGKLV